jgi:hypothetical protein
MQGTRLADGEWLSRAADGEIKPGDYGKCDADWFVCCPDRRRGFQRGSHPASPPCTSTLKRKDTSCQQQQQ